MVVQLYFVCLDTKGKVIGVQILYVPSHKHLHETTMNNGELSTVTRQDLICVQNNSHRNGEIHDLPFLRCDPQKVSQNEYQQFNGLRKKGDYS